MSSLIDSGVVGDRMRSRRSAVYRGDVDGLRGLAIALVVVFHVWFGRVSGGVDVFLVLSGFFFTDSLLRRGESNGAVGVAYTLRRTLRRLLPALVVVLAAVVAAVVVISPYTQWSDMAAQALASAFYYQNWQLALSWADYLAADPTVSPLQHLWSMSVQGQFYLATVLVVAVLVWLCRRVEWISARGAVFAVAIGVGVVSFGYAAHGTVDHQGWNYYDTFARAWEPLAGAALAAVAPLLRPALFVRWMLATLGLAGVLACGWILDGANEFPGPAALLPVGAAIAMIVSGANVEPAGRPLPNRLLATPPMVRLGELAYALYLWHWPLLIFVLAETGQAAAGFGAGLGVICASLLLAEVTHRWIEQPLRMRRGGETPRVTHGYPKVARVAVALLGVLTIGIAGTWHVVVRASPPQAAQTLVPDLYPGAEALASGLPTPDAPMRPSALGAAEELPPPTRDGCISDWNTREVVTCVYGVAEAGRTLAVVGSSHAEHWLSALQVLAEQHGFRITVYLKMGCPLIVTDEPLDTEADTRDCLDWSREVLDRLDADRPDWVFTTGTRPVDEGGDETPVDYLAVWDELSARGLNTVVIRDTPWLRRNGIRYRAVDCLTKGGDRLSCGMPRADALSPDNPAVAAAAAYPTIFPIDLSDAVCGPDICAAVEGNVLVYHDEHHLTATYSRTLAPALGRRLAPILGWW
ncbi:acyltransferase family protein [Nocardia sp. NPDC050406]|uniref:acyltransferase family protein n=1 Tax=Nocardia sp. NPDC050406 TaxID=3364318 RepID=UPI0037AF2DC4